MNACKLSISSIAAALLTNWDCTLLQPPVQWFATACRVQASYTAALVNPSESCRTSIANRLVVPVTQLPVQQLLTKVAKEEEVCH